MANQQARQDDSKFTALLGHSSITDPSETRRVLATEGGLHNVLQDGDGNEIESHLDADGGYHLGVAMSQAVYADANNTSIVDLDPDETFTGASTSTLGVAGLQWNLHTDQNCTVCIEQSPDGTNWDVSDCWDYYYAKGGRGETFTPVAGTYYKLDIEFTPLGAWFYINGKLLHKVLGASKSGSMTLPVTIENNNTAVDDDTSFSCVGAFIARFGELVTNPTSEKSTGTQAEVVCKRGAGIIRGLLLSDITTGAIITLYDGLVATGTEIWSSGESERKSTPFFIDFFEAPFSTGLSYDVTDAAANVTVVYE